MVSSRDPPPAAEGPKPRYRRCASKLASSRCCDRVVRPAELAGQPPVRRQPRAKLALERDLCGHSRRVSQAGRLDESRIHLEDAIADAERGGHDFFNALSRSINGMRMFVSGDLDGGIAMVESARRIQIRNSDFESGGMALSFLASMTFAKGDFPAAIQLYRQAEASFETIGDKPEIARVHCEMGYAALAASSLDEARGAFQQALRTFDEVGSPRGAGQALIGLAAVEAAAGNSERAVTVAAAALVMSERAGVVVEHPMAPGVTERIEKLRASIPAQQLKQLVASGSALSPDAVLRMVADQ